MKRISHHIFLSKTAYGYSRYGTVFQSQTKAIFIVSIPPVKKLREPFTRFFTVSQTAIDGWLVPLHCHPELMKEGVKDAIASAIHVSQDTFAGIAERRKERVSHYYWVHGWRKHVWERTYQSQFLGITHQSDTTFTLRLRRDMQECYIVKNTTSLETT